MHSTRQHRHDREEGFAPEIGDSENEIGVSSVAKGDSYSSPPSRTRLMPRLENLGRLRTEAALRKQGYANYGGDWQCPACRCRIEEDAGTQRSDLSLRLEGEGEVVRLRCSRGCRPNTIRAILGMAPYLDDSRSTPTSGGGGGSKH